MEWEPGETAGVTCPPTAPVIEAETMLRLLAPDVSSSGVPVRCGLIYDPADPYAVHLAFRLDGRGSGETVAWSFARDLLAAGLHQPSGLGDVRIWPWTGPEGETIALALSSPDGQALLEAPRRPLAGFLAAAYGSVPAGREAQHLGDPDRWLRP